MAKKSVVARQKRREEMVKRHWDKRQDLKKRSIDPNLSEEERQDARIALNKMPRNGSPIRLRSRCKLTGRPRGVYKKFKISRLCLREFANAGLIPGMTKASW